MNITWAPASGKEIIPAKAFGQIQDYIQRRAAQAACQKTDAQSGPGERGDLSADPGHQEHNDSPQIEMGIIKPFYETDSVVRDAARAMLERQGACQLFEYSSPLGTERQLYAARLWLQKLGTDVDESNLMIVAGAQNALSVIRISLRKNTGLRGIYLMPACSNPTGTFMPQNRRSWRGD